MADSKAITPTPALEYSQLIWGDHIYGTKDQIQALGIGVGLSFPGEIGGPRCRLKVPDPRGFLVRIEAAPWRGEGAFTVHIPLFEEHPRPKPIAQPCAPGVTKCEWRWADEYCGTAEALAAFGLIQPNQLPGQPGMRKLRVRILPDGSVLGGPPTANCAETKNPGAKVIERAGVGMFRVRVLVTEELARQRNERQEIAELEWKQRIQALPRPAPLTHEGHKVETGMEQRAGELANFKKPEEWLEQKEDHVCLFARVYLSAKFASVVTKSGMRYSVDPARLSEILNEIEAAAQRLRDLPLKVEVLANSPQRKEARDKAALASSDGQFQRFMQTAMVMPKPDGKQARP